MMGLLLDAVRFAFAPGGPAETFAGQHRTMQENFSVGFGEYAEDASAADLVRLFVQEVQAGSGKTLVIVVVLGLDCLLSKRGSMVATFRRSLRSDYLAEVPLANQIIRATLTGIGQKRLFRPLVVAEYISPTGYMSPTKIEFLRREIDAERIKRSDKLDHLLRFYDTCLSHGDVAEFSAYFAEGGELPDDMTELDLCMTPVDKATAEFIGIREANLTAREADILLITHAMLVRNSIARGLLLDTTRDRPTDDEMLRTGIMVADEADKLPEVAYSTVTFVMSQLMIERLLTAIEERYTAPSTREMRHALSTGLALIRSGLERLNNWKVGRTPPVSIVFAHDSPIPDDIFLPALKDIDNGLSRLRFLPMGDYDISDRDPLLYDWIRRVQQDIEAIRRFETGNFPKMLVSYMENADGDPDLRVLVNLSYGRHLISQLWRSTPSSPPVHTFCGVALISATITDPPPNDLSYRWFLRAIDYQADKDVMTCLPPIRRSRTNPWGRVNDVFVMERDSTLRPTDLTETDLLNRTYLDAAVAVISLVANRQLKAGEDKRMLVLCPSYDLVDALAERLGHLKDRIIHRQRASNFHADLRRFASLSGGIWIGVEWEGVNFVHPTDHRTLVNYLVIARLPQPPYAEDRVQRVADFLRGVLGDEAAAERRAEGVHLREGNALAYRRFVQGIARGTRNQTDVIDECWILDIRFPVPDHVFATRRIARSAGDPTKMFRHFHEVFNNLGVRHWWEVTANGKLRMIL